MASTIAKAAAGIKQAQAPAVSWQDLSRRLDQEQSREVLRRLSQLAVGSLAVGAAGGIGAATLPVIGRQLREAAGIPSPLLLRTEGSEEGRTVKPLAVTKTSTVTQWLQDRASDVATAIGSKAKDIFAGRKTTRPLAFWAAPPVILGSALAGSHLGYSGTKAVNDKLRALARRHELEIAKRDYEEALSGTSKESRQLDGDLSTVYGFLSEKQAQGSPPYTAEDLVGLLTGLGLSASLVGGYGGFQLGRGIGKKTQNRRLLEEAQKLRLRRRYLRSPIPVLAVNQPPGSSEPAARREDEDKAAPALV